MVAVEGIHYQRHKYYYETLYQGLCELTHDQISQLELSYLAGKLGASFTFTEEVANDQISAEAEPERVGVGEDTTDAVVDEVDRYTEVRDGRSWEGLVYIGWTHNLRVKRFGPGEV